MKKASEYGKECKKKKKIHISGSPLRVSLDALGAILGVSCAVSWSLDLAYILTLMLTIKCLLLHCSILGAPIITNLSEYVTNSSPCYFGVKIDEI